MALNIGVIVLGTVMHRQTAYNPRKLRGEGEPPAGDDRHRSTTCRPVNSLHGSTPSWAPSPHFRYAVETGNPGFLVERYARLLEKHGGSPTSTKPLDGRSCPSLAEQHQWMGFFTAPFTVVRLLTPLGMSYEAAKKRAAPYTKIVEELSEMWRETVDLVKKAIAENRRSYLLVNNRSEGNAPMTVKALVDRLREQ